MTIQKQPPSWMAAIAEVCRMLGPLQLEAPIGGSCGLAMQGVDIGKIPRDIDMYYDRVQRDILHSILLPYQKAAPHESETERYRSILSHYELEGCLVECVGAFEVRAYDSIYSVEIGGWMKNHTVQVTVEGMDVTLMPLVHELAFNLLRDRMDRVESIACVMRQDLVKHQAGVRDLVSSQSLSRAMIQRIEAHLGCKVS